MGDSPGNEERRADGSAADSRFGGVLDASFDPLLVLVPVRELTGAIADFLIEDCNTAAAGLCGVPRELALGRSPSEFLAATPRRWLIERLVPLLADGAVSHEEIVVPHGGGAHRWRLRIVCAGDALAIAAHDITDVVRPNELSAETLARVERILDDLRDGFYRISPGGHFLSANKVSARVLLGTDNGLVGRHFLEFVRADWRAATERQYTLQIAERVPFTYFEFPAVTASGAEMWIGQNVHLEQAVDGTVIALHAVARDISERRRAELALRESEERHRVLAERSVDVLSRHAMDGTLLYVSPGCRKLAGYEPIHLLGRNVYDLVHPEDLAAARAAQTAHPEGDQWTFTVRLRHRDGRWRWFETSVQVVRDPGTGVDLEVVCVSRDVTVRRRLEEDLRHAQKMEAIGQLAGGVAHDFNNILTAIGGFNDILAAALAEQDPRLRYVREIGKATDRASRLTQQLLSMSRKQASHARRLSLNDFVVDAAPMLARLLGSHITLVTRLDPLLGTVVADPSHVEQVLMNLCVNGRDAMPRGGVVEIATANVDLAGADAIERGLAAGAYATLTVTDGGIGMGPELRDHIFEPFFTTKPEGKGTGLGLATVYGIVHHAGGHVGVRSAPGEGTSISVYLPRAGDGEFVRVAPPPRVAIPSGAGRVLIVEPDEAVRVMLGSVLESAGYAVREAAGTGDAMAALDDASQAPDAVVSELHLGRQGAGVIVDRLRVDGRRIPVILLAGLLDDVELSADERADRVTRLAKPFSAERLIAAVRGAIAAT